MKKIVFVLGFLFFAIDGKSQTFIQAYQDRANLVSQTNINTYLNEFVGYGVKTTGTTNNVNALNWLKAKYASFGYTTAQMQEDTFNFGSGVATSKNLIVTKTGTLYPNIFVIVSGHFDTIVGPGAGDNGSGTAAILETARILKDIPTEYSIKFIHFSGEEQGLLGSTHYVNNVVNATNPKLNIRVVFNLDQVGATAGQTHNTIYCESDQSLPLTNNAASLSMTQQLATCTTLYSPLQTVMSQAYASDYVPFQNNGEIITGFYEFNGSNNPNTHSNNDIIANMDPTYVFKVAKAAVGATQHFAIASSQNLSTNESKDHQIQFDIAPNPAKDFINIIHSNSSLKSFTFEIYDLSGKLILRTKNQDQVDVSKLANGVYLGTFTSDKVKISKQIVIKK